MVEIFSKETILKKSLEEVFSLLNSSKEGLDVAEAQKRLNSYGLNIIKKNTVKVVPILLRQFQTSLIYLLSIASILSYFIGEYSNGTIILIILLINTSLGFFQEYRAEKTVEKLSQFISAMARIKRGGQILLEDQSHIVVGDVIVIKEGDIVPADIRLFDTEALEINESSLTGESMPVLKEVNLGDERELAFTGSIVEKGEGIGVVYATGFKTEFGNIAALSQETKRTRYEESLLAFGTFLIKIVMGGLLLVFVSKLFFNRGGLNITELFIFIIAMAVAVVPEVLPVITTFSLSRGALKLAKKHVVVKRLSSVEDLGNITILCTDKTGTITENKMTIKSLVSDDSRLLQLLAYASIAPLKMHKHRAQNSYDDAFGEYVSLPLQHESKQLKIIQEFPFDPHERRRRVILEDTKQKGTKKTYYLVVIGAPDALLKVSRKKQPRYLKDIEAEGKQGLHHLALAYKEIKYREDFDIIKNEKSLIFLGYVTLYDPLRPSAKQSMAHAKKLGIAVKILTGDRKEVAEYIGREIGLLGETDGAFTGDELEKMPKEKFTEVVKNSSVFARVSPTQKYNIIKALKGEGVVAYQGDGINDAPSLKAADVAIAVSSATDIAKESADIVILNKSLEVIINGIKQGRAIFIDINKYITYTMTNNFGNFIALSILYLFSAATLPLLPIQILISSLITDVPLISVSLDSVEEGEIIKPEKHNMKELLFIPLILGIPTALFELFYYTLIRHQAPAVVQTSLFVFFSLTLVVFYALRNKQHFWKAKLPPKNINIIFCFAFIVSIAIIYIPFFQQHFSFVPLPISSFALILFIIMLYFLTIDALKTLYWRKSQGY